MKDCIYYNDEEAKSFREINKEEAKIGDYAKIDGFSGFCYGRYNKITNILTLYDEITGKPYRFVCCGDNWYHFDSGWCIKGASAYKIFGYYRL